METHGSEAGGFYFVQMGLRRANRKPFHRGDPGEALLLRVCAGQFTTLFKTSKPRHSHVSSVRRRCAKH